MNRITVALICAFFPMLALADPKLEPSNPKHAEMQKQIDRKLKADPKYRIDPAQAQNPRTPTPTPNIVPR